MSDSTSDNKGQMGEDQLAQTGNSNNLSEKQMSDKNSSFAQESERASKKKGRIYALKFAAVISFVCCMLLTGASVGLKGFQLENMEVDRQKNILKAAGILHQEEIPSKIRIRQIYREKIEEVHVNSDGTISDQVGKQLTGAPLPLYLYKEHAGQSSSPVKAYIIPIESRGLWGKIYGYLAFENNGITIAGFTVYSHSETPGLGGEIEKGWFQKNFIGKKIVNSSNEFVSIAIAKGSAANLPEEEQSNHVDGISGATLTGKYLTQGLKENLEQYEAVSIKFRQGKQL